MAHNIQQHSPRGIPFFMIEPLFYEELQNNYSFLPEWKLGRISKNVKTNRLILDEYNMDGGWLFVRYNGSGIFRCTKCIKRGESPNDVSWHSAYVTYLFRATYGWETEPDGEDQWWGSVEMKVFAQACKNCGEYMPAEINQNQALSLARWICQWIGSNFHQSPTYSRGYQGARGKAPHLKQLCEARQHKWCKYCNG